MKNVIDEGISGDSKCMHLPCYEVIQKVRLDLGENTDDIFVESTPKISFWTRLLGFIGL